MKKKLIYIFLLFIILIPIAAIGKSIDVNYDNGIYHIILDGKNLKNKIEFVASESLITNKEAHIKNNSVLTVNAGFFDPNNQKTISYIVTNYITSEDPLLNENLLMNPLLRKNIDKIINRTEFRVLDCNGNYSYEIVPHKTPVNFMCSIVTSAQGGPMLLPELNLEEEFFILKNKDGKITRESASVLSKTARTIIGLKGDEIHILIITNKNPKTIYEARDLCKELKLDRAMAFDGGSSTSFNYKSIDITSTPDSCGRMLKSFLIIKK